MSQPTCASFDISSERSDLNQYWYSSSSIASMVAEIEMHATKAAFLSTPSLFFSLTNGKLRESSCVFEFDKQWERDPGFVFYDFNFPDRIPVQLMGQFDYIIVDPPFITREVWVKYMETVKLLLVPKGGKVLFSSILENHSILEEMLDAPLWIARYRPSIPHLTYQYHLFLNYLNSKLEMENAELPPEDAKIRAALRMANDLRESETQFAAQMRNRDRAGEQLLPLEQPSSASDDQPVGGGGGRVMKWTRVPEGLTMYANGADAPPPTGDGSTADFGPEYARLVAFRNSLEQFKRGVDQSQRHLDKLLKLSASAKQDSEEYRSETAARMALLDSMSTIIISLAAAAPGGSSNSSGDASLLRVMEDCVREYREVPIIKDRLQELAADATRKFKSPLFNRQKELLQEIKKAKADFATTSGAPASEE
jgi:hypothetical protein